MEQGGTSWALRRKWYFEHANLLTISRRNGGGMGWGDWWWFRCPDKCRISWWEKALIMACIINKSGNQLLNSTRNLRDHQWEGETGRGEEGRCGSCSDSAQWGVLIKAPSWIGTLSTQVEVIISARNEYVLYNVCVCLCMCVCIRSWWSG